MAKAKKTKPNTGKSFADRMAEARAKKRQERDGGVVPPSGGVKERAGSSPPPEPPARVLPSISDASIDRLLGLAAKKFGRGAVVRLGDPGAYEEVKVVIPTGFPSLDRVFGVGGLPLGKITQIWGRPSSGKTTLSKYLAMRAQMVGIIPSVKDTEKSGILEFDTGLGIDVDHALAAQPSVMEDVFNQILLEVENIGKDRLLGIWDSIAATPLRAELERGVEDTTPVGERARFLSQHLKKLIDLLDERVGLLFVNQVRTKIGAGPYAPQDFAPGGWALDHYCHVSLRTTHIGFIKAPGSADFSDPVGMRFRVKAVKSKIAPPFREAELHFFFGDKDKGVPPRLVDPEAPQVKRVAVTE